MNTSNIPKLFIVFINFFKTNKENLRENKGVKSDFKGPNTNANNTFLEKDNCTNFYIPLQFCEISSHNVILS